ncbi:BON domain-containing protein [Variovorax sp. PAMC28562]|uniref:BON domain-containing protein n=1 Tax=Variovorax sp. PAMC28562 TaxID=2762323 RepID=UPI00164EAA81|nr:BON domain-containing protein [Variovorax sp. PAMC28562]QNK75578.1 BON domain-containing protein [Variovorax sp. PAMC28562]
MNKAIRTFPRPMAAFFVLAIAGAAALSACDSGNNRTVGEKVDAGIAKTEQAAKTAAAKTGEMIADPKLKADIKDAGAAISATVDDAAITAAVAAGLAKDPDLSAIKINVTTTAGVVNLKGPAPTAEAKSRAEDIAKSVHGVTSVKNQLEVRA